MKQILSFILIICTLFAFAACASSDTEPVQEAIRSVAGWKAGDKITFGSYEQDNDLSNGKEQIGWIVLDVNEKEGTICLISEYALDAAQYHGTSKKISWEKCALRAKLNDEFYNEAFDENEKAKIVETVMPLADESASAQVSAKGLPEKIFLIDSEEALTLFKLAEDRKCIPTPYAKAQGVYTSSTGAENGKETCWWWLRGAVDALSTTAPMVGRDGAVNRTGDSVTLKNVGLRPAVWIKPDPKA